MKNLTDDTATGEARQRLDHLRLITVELAKRRPLYQKQHRGDTKRRGISIGVLLQKRGSAFVGTAHNAWPRGKKEFKSGEIPLILCVLY